MHPYCMAVCVDSGDGEQMLPEGGILLEVVDRGEHGEPILAIPDLGLPWSVLQDTLAKEHHAPEESDKAAAATDSCEEIVVVDDDTTTMTTITGAMEMKAELMAAAAASARNAEKVKCEGNKKQKSPRTKEIKEKSPPRRKKASKAPLVPPPAIEGRILRSAVTRNKEYPRKLKKQPIKVKESVPSASGVSTSANASSKPKKMLNAHKEVSKRTLPRDTRANAIALNPLPVKETPVRGPPSCPAAAVSSVQPSEGQRLAASPTKPEVLTTAAAPALPIPRAVPVATDGCSYSGGPTPPEALQPQVTTPPPPTPDALKEDEVPAPAPEPKPKSLSLAEYRRLRQQKKPAPVEKPEDHRTKWPSLPEAPKELPPIPCLPDPSPKDTRRSAPVSGKGKEAAVEEVKPAWHPTGPGAPPTPEALLAPPAYMASTKAGAATLMSKRQQEAAPRPRPVSEAAGAAAAPQPSSSSSAAPSSSSVATPGPVKNPSPQTDASAEKPRVPQSSTQCSSTPSESKPARPPPQPSTPIGLVCNQVPSKTTTESPQADATPASSARRPANAGPVSIAATSVSDPLGAFAKCLSVVAGARPASLAAQPSSQPRSMKVFPVRLGAPQGPATPQTKKRTASQALIEAFTSEIGECLLYGRRRERAAYIYLNVT